MKVAIVGMGTAGVSILRQLVKHEMFEHLEVDIYDNRKNMGQGEPFQNDSEDLLINVPVDMLSLNLDNMKEFREWYASQDDFDYGDAEYLPRYVFGHYMKSYLDQYVKRYDNIHVIPHEVTQIGVVEEEKEISVKKIIVQTDEHEGRSTIYDYVFLSTGTFSYNDPYHLKGSPKYIYEPYPAYRTLDEVSSHDKVAVIGTGLASLDVIRYVLNHHDQTLVLASRGGQLPSVRGEMVTVTLQYMTKEIFDDIKQNHMGNIPLDILKELFRKECDALNIPFKSLIHRRTGNVVKDLQYDLAHPESLGLLQSFLMELKDNMNWIWNSLTNDDQQLFLERYYQYFKENMNPMPRDTAQFIIDEIESNKLRVYAGLEKATRVNGQYQLQFETEHQAMIVDVIINATGPKKKLSQLDASDGLLLNMANKQIVQAHPIGGIQIVSESNEVISPRYGTLSNLRAFGQMTNGVNFERNGVTMIVQQAVKSVTQLYAQLEEEYDAD
ncbi:pyridine nucleotide-disulfide oxidoreductase [Staphylococcus muscae]|nr:FAD/NAD(P)-binding protein [Staphylococcus muscae]AVQ33313.1 pyridine nucleotide-disulfide oxidoreductase [Staphylococcus muscae]PNZ01931.1 pyridine nucleotide-disulfide oxidoreductase [Staphylococcus muscae]GGA94658.1 pyridine nucleotide-disulfide oxidoreductase [Staphylococcus muscae]